MNLKRIAAGFVLALTLSVGTAYACGCGCDWLYLYNVAINLGAESIEEFPEYANNSCPNHAWIIWTAFDEFRNNYHGPLNNYAVYYWVIDFLWHEVQGM